MESEDDEAWRELRCLQWLLEDRLHAGLLFMFDHAWYACTLSMDFNVRTPSVRGILTAMAEIGQKAVFSSPRPLVDGSLIVCASLPHVPSSPAAVGLTSIFRF